MLMRVLSSAVALMSLVLAGCGGPNAPGQPAEAPPAPSAQAAAPVAPDTPDVVEAAYDCQPAMALSVRYDNATDPPKATVTIDGKPYVLAPVISGSGARYLTTNGRTPGTTLIWWNKGDEGTLFEGKDEQTALDTIVTTCKEKAPT
jgi:membrane-bound inhibitor of C-type lysozyme